MSEIKKRDTEFSTIANDVMRFADQIKNAGEFIPQSFRGNAGAIAAAILTGRELGLEPMASLRSLYVVQGKVGISYDAIVGLLRGHGYRVDWVETTIELATVKITHKEGSSITLTYSSQDAKTAGLWGKGVGWSKHPATMLRARCISNAARAFAGDILSGIYTPDEIDEIKEREEKPVNTIKTPRKSGIDSALEAVEKINSEAEIDVKAETVDEEVNEEQEIFITEADLLLDEIESANNLDELELCAKKIKSSENLSKDEKGLLRDKYKEVKEGLND